MEKLVYNYDVVVIGGGVAGVSAALASARSNKKTLLIESTYMVGGLATSGLVAFFLPIDDGEGHQISYGICEELFRLSILHGYEGNYPEAWLNNGTIEEKIKKRFDVQFNPHLFAILCEQKLVNEKVDLLYGCIISSVVVEDGKIVKLIGHTRTQDVEVFASSFVDSTGDATICEKAGVPTNCAERGNVQTNWYYSIEDGKYNIHMMGSCDYVYSDGKEHTWFKGLDSNELTDVTVVGHRNIMEDFLKKGDGTDKYAIATISTIPELRMTRKFVGEEEMKKDENGLYKENSLGLITSWLTSGLNYELPAGCLYNKNVKNLYVAGRCISVFNDHMWDITRGIPACTVTGEASGYLAANFPDNTKIDIKKSQCDLSSRGVKIHLSELGL